MTLQPTRKSKQGYLRRKGKTVYIHMGIWYDKKSGQIHVTGPKEKKLHSTISNNPKSRRYHPNLHKKLKEILERERCW